MDLSIVIVSWKVREKLRANLRTLFESEGDFKFEVIVVDNDSDDGTIEMLDKDFPQVEVVENIYNVGFARACNQGINLAQGDYVLLLNPDMQVFLDTLANMLKWMKENPQAAVASCRLEDESGETIRHVRAFPTLFDQLMIVLKIPHLFPGILNKYLRSDFDYSCAAKVDSIRGAFFMVDINNEKKPPFWLDERYFIWFEEVDYCRKVAEMGGEVWYTPAAKCTDFVGASFRQVSSLRKQKYFRDSMLKYFQKWQPAWQYWVLKIIWPLGLGMSSVASKLKIRIRKSVN